MLISHDIDCWDIRHWYDEYTPDIDAMRLIRLSITLSRHSDRWDKEVDGYGLRAFVISSCRHIAIFVCSSVSEFFVYLRHTLSAVTSASRYYAAQHITLHATFRFRRRSILLPLFSAAVHTFIFLFSATSLAYALRASFYYTLSLCRRCRQSLRAMPLKRRVIMPITQMFSFSDTHYYCHFDTIICLISLLPYALLYATFFTLRFAFSYTPWWYIFSLIFLFYRYDITPIVFHWRHALSWAIGGSGV